MDEGDVMGSTGGVVEILVGSVVILVTVVAPLLLLGFVVYLLVNTHAAVKRIEKRLESEAGDRPVPTPRQ